MLKVYNSLTRRLEQFEPLHEGFVGIYVCGPTVYGHSHVGHAKSYVSFDAVVRYLRFLGYRVRYVQNITDVGHLTDDADAGEDKVDVKARQMGVAPMEVAQLYTRSYFEDMDALNVQRPDISPCASGHIPEQIALIRKLVDGGHAYEVDGAVYFDVQSFPEYGRLSGRNLDELLEGTRVEARGDKRHPADFALWKKSEPGHIMRWDSPWGVGYPGWHIECSAMSMAYLGETFDIHGGGIENIFPHHEDEIAQAEAATGQQFVRYWLHNNMVTVDGQKMGKSLGNFITLKDAFAGRPPLDTPIRPMVMRYFILTSHYRSPLDFSMGALEAAGKGLERIENAVRRVRESLRGTVEGAPSGQIQQLLDETREKFLAEMDNDFNTAGAIGEMSAFTREVNRLMDEGDAVTRDGLEAVNQLYEQLGGQVLGIVTDESGRAVESAGIESDLVDAMLEVREDLRKAGHYELADGVRRRLSKLGVQVKDSADGPTWRFKKGAPS
ncbi:MAG: cysteine--tRNA ligase [Planctomycetes bacterium]|nr:cysteine--tRNA ligase [Planctomycetota bacterium]